MEPEDICPNLPGEQRHVPDPGTLRVDYDGEDAYVDVSCKYCLGCVGKFDPESVDW